MKNLKFLFFLSLLTFTLTTTQSCKDACDDVVCENGGTCDDGDCLCEDGFTGTNCENNSNSFTVDGNTYLFATGFLEEFGSNGNGSFDFDVTLTTSGIDLVAGFLVGTGNLIYLDLNSNSEAGLVDGTYTFSAAGEREAFELTDGICAIDFVIATATGQTIGVSGGTVEVKVVGENYTIDFDLQSMSGAIVGNYSGPLTSN